MSSIARSVPYKRTVDHLRAWSLKLPNHLRVASVSFNETDRAHDGLRLFVYQHVPQLKFHNPNVKFLVTGRTTNCTIEFINNDKEENILNLQDKSHKDIMKLIEGLYPQDCLNEQTDNNDNIVE